MTLVLVTPPPELPVTEEEVWAHLRLTLVGSPAEPKDKADVLAMINAAVSEIDGRDGWLGRALVEQTWDLKLERFGAEIRLPLPPLRSVTSISYVDIAGDTQTLGATQYQVAGVDGFAKIVPAHGVTWPATRSQPEAVTVRFVAGYAKVDGSPVDYRANIPSAIRTAIKLHVEMLYDRDPNAQVPLKQARDSLLAPLRVWG